MPRSEYRRQGGFSLHRGHRRDRDAQAHLRQVRHRLCHGLPRGGRAAAREREALAVAEGYLSEATSRPYLDPDTNGLCGGVEANRTLFDNVCDYNGLASNGCTTTTHRLPDARQLRLRPRRRADRRAEGIRRDRLRRAFHLERRHGPSGASAGDEQRARLEHRHPPVVSSAGLKADSCAPTRCSLVSR
mgnify:CR=1 FL=1